MAFILALGLASAHGADTVPPAKNTGDAKAEPAPSTTPLPVLIKRYKAIRSGRTRKAVIADLVSYGEDAVAPMVALYDAGGIPEESAIDLIGGLGSIPSQASTTALLGIIQGVRDDTSHCQAHDKVVGAALVALSRMSFPAATTALLAFAPASVAEESAHIRALTALPEAAVAQRLTEYVLSEQKAISSLAGRVLVTWSRGNKASTERALTSLIKRIEKLSAKKELTHVNRNTVRICLSFKREGTRAEMLAECLESESASLRGDCMKSLAGNEALLAQNTLYDALQDAMEEEEDAEALIAGIEAVKRSRLPDGIHLVAPSLEHANAKVRASAAEAMGVLTKKKLGRNPTAWLKWYRKEYGG